MEGKSIKQDRGKRSGHTTPMTGGIKLHIAETRISAAFRTISLESDRSRFLASSETSILGLDPKGEANSDFLFAF